MITLSRRIDDPFGVIPQDELAKLAEAIKSATRFSEMQKSLSMFSLAMLSQKPTHLLESIDLLSRELGKILQDFNFESQWESYRRFEELDAAV